MSLISAVAKILKGDPKFQVAALAQGHAYYFLGGIL